jgi:hypothetical protein
VIKCRIHDVDYWESDALVTIGKETYFFALGNIVWDEPPSIIDALAYLIAANTTIIIETTIEL